jgi:predicted DNA-binding transcriptional regulator AlpA
MTTTTPTVRVGLPALPTPDELERADADELRGMMLTDRSLAAYFGARADIVSEALSRRSRVSSSTSEPLTAALDVNQVAALLGVSKQWVYRASRPGGPLHGCARRAGRRVTWDRLAVTRWRDRQRPR